MKEMREEETGLGLIYDIEVKEIKGETISLEKYKGKVLLIVNTASKCGFTPQFKELQALHETYYEKGLTILGFPCDQFMNQEFDKEEEIAEFCQVNYGVTFPMFSKVDVKGENAHPLFQYLTKEKSGLLTENIKWNFTKFLLSRDGEVVERFAPQSSPAKMEKNIKKLI